jgi:hypothetical protein
MPIVTIEIATKKNSNLLFGPNMERLRGRWSRTNLKGGKSMHAALAEMPDIPGLYLTVDTTKRLLVVSDPLLETKDGKELNRRLELHLEQFESQFGRMRAKPRVETEDATDEQIKTWLYWFRRLINNEQARVVSGDVPELKDFAKMPGKVVAEPFNILSDKRYKDLGEPKEDKAGAGKDAGGKDAANKS